MFKKSTDIFVLTVGVLRQENGVTQGKEYKDINV